jgi:polysaccharide deacetylase family protein (PEP-CTERM system associated)
MHTEITNAMSVDVEDYFHVSAFEKNIDPIDWDTLPCRVEYNTHKILALFQQANISSTFFVLGWVAERYPQLVKEIVAQGHELASHGYAHQRATLQSHAVFRQDIDRAKKLLEDISAKQILGYRAPSYSISNKNLWAHDELLAAGYQYSSSVYPVKHDLYGMPDAPRFAYRCPNGLLEIPISTVQWGHKNIPAGGCGFFRLFPYALSKWNIKQVNKKEHEATIFYFHPWEIDPDQPRQKNISLKSRIRHYLNLQKMQPRLVKLLSDFNWDRMDHIFLNQH